mmetsp:Transcript_95198/g.183564  ORF Transcript_95198/g.183564 Transcript_95198/m.183564 type:complete len:197 (+) Transcript_95198:149-739(+)
MQSPDEHSLHYACDTATTRSSRMQSQQNNALKRSVTLFLNQGEQILVTLHVALDCFRKLLTQSCNAAFDGLASVGCKPLKLMIQFGQMILNKLVLKQLRHVLVLFTSYVCLQHNVQIADECFIDAPFISKTLFEIVRMLLQHIIACFLLPKGCFTTFGKFCSMLPQAVAIALAALGFTAGIRSQRTEINQRQPRAL